MVRLVDEGKVTTKEIGAILQVNESTVLAYKKKLRITGSKQKRRESCNKKIYKKKYRKRIMNLISQYPNMGRRQIALIASKEYHWLKDNDRQWLYTVVSPSKRSVQPNLDSYRGNLLRFMKAHPNAKRSYIIKMLPAEYYWLKMHDTEWLMNALPQKDESYKKVDWVSRDKIFANIIEETVESFQMEGKPKHITLNAIIKVIPKLRSILQNKTYAPKLIETRRVLCKVIQSKEEYLIRCVDWAWREVRKQGSDIDEMAIYEKLGKNAAKNVFVRTYVRKLIAGGSK